MSQRKIPVSKALRSTPMVTGRTPGRKPGLPVSQTSGGKAPADAARRPRPVGGC